MPEKIDRKDYWRQSSEYAGVSNEKIGENPIRRKPKVSRGRVVLPGLVGS